MVPGTGVARPSQSDSGITKRLGLCSEDCVLVLYLAIKLATKYENCPADEPAASVLMGAVMNPVVLFTDELLNNPATFALLTSEPRKAIFWRPNRQFSIRDFSLPKMMSQLLARSACSTSKIV